jgi:hypothetical protein
MSDDPQSHAAIGWCLASQYRASISKADRRTIEVWVFICVAALENRACPVALRRWTHTATARRRC